MSRTLFVAACLLCSLPAVAPADDWPQFLGPNRDGKSAETGLIDAFPDSGPKVLWKVDGGVGMSGFAVVGNRAITMWQTGGRQRVVALDVTSGKTLWSTPVAPSYRNQMGNGPRGTPAVDGGSVFAFTGKGILVSLKLSDGSVNWTKNPLKDLGGKPADYGMACSPLVVGDLVVVTAGTKAGTVVAYNKADGKVAWKAGKEATGYSSPALRKVGGKSQIVVYTGSAALGLEPKTGAQLWRYPYVTDYDCNITTPLNVGGNVFISSGENHGSALLALEPNGKTFSVKPVWTSNGAGSVMRNEWQTSILLDGYLYGLDNVGSAGPVTHLACINAKTGKRAWQQRRFGKSNLIYADGKLWFTTMKGELVIVKATPKGFRELARSKPLLGMTRQAPILANGRLFLRDDRRVVCVSVAK